MKLKRILNVFLACAMSLSIAAMPAAYSNLEKQNINAQENITSISQTEAKKDNGKVVKAENNVESSTATQNEKAITLTAEDAVKNTDKNDIFYEPDEKSITVLDDSSAYINDTVIVFLTDNATTSDLDRVVKSINGKIVGSSAWMNEYEIQIQHSEFDSLNKICEELMEDASVDFASCSIATKFTPDYIPDDPWGEFADWSPTPDDMYYNNWWIKAVDAQLAWDYADSFSTINIGIVDGGFDTENEDLKDKISFPNNFFKSNNAPDGHGTHVAGIIAAKADNGVGISGICQKSNLICVDWEANEETGQTWNSEARILSGFVNTVRAGAKVINFSLGSSGTIANGTTDRYQFVKDAEGKFTSYYIAKLLERGYDFLCCQSAGNGTWIDDETFYAVDSSNNGSFSAITLNNAVKFVRGVSPQDILDRIIIVAASEKVGVDEYVQATYSNGGKGVEICAPGSSIYSTYYDDDAPFTHYTYLTGTSMAAPIVTGIASLVWSVNQSFNAAQVKHFVCDKENTKFDVPDNSSESHLPTGSIPMVNAKLAVEAAIKSIENNGTVSGTITLNRISALNKIPYTVINKTTGELYRFFTDENGSFSANLPDGQYTLEFDGGIISPKYDFSVTSGNETILDDIVINCLSVDAGSYAGVMMDSMEDFLTFIKIY